VPAAEPEQVDSVFSRLPKRLKRPEAPSPPLSYLRLHLWIGVISEHASCLVFFLPPPPTWASLLALISLHNVVAATAENTRYPIILSSPYLSPQLPPPLFLVPLSILFCKSSPGCIFRFVGVLVLSRISPKTVHFSP